MKNIFVLLLLSVFVVACQKELTFDSNNPDGGNTAGTPLIKMVSKTGADSSVIDFSYTANRVTFFKVFSSSGGVTINLEQRAIRNSNGIIERVILKADQLSQAGIDSLITYVKYNSSTSRYTAKILVLEFFGFQFKDSTAFIYDAAGKITTEMSYSDDGFGNFEPSGKIEYTYSGSNLASMKNFDWDDATSTYIQDQLITYDEYDNKHAGLTMGNEAFVFTSPTFYSANNATKSSTVVNGSTTLYNATYVYNSFNKPVTASGVTQPGNVSSSASYYYQ